MPAKKNTRKRTRMSSRKDSSDPPKKRAKNTQPLRRSLRNHRNTSNIESNESNDSYSDSDSSSNTFSPPIRRNNNNTNVKRINKQEAEENSFVLLSPHQKHTFDNNLTQKINNIIENKNENINQNEIINQIKNIQKESELMKKSHQQILKQYNELHKTNENDRNDLNKHIQKLNNKYINAKQ
eukprot:282068_1